MFKYYNNPQEDAIKLANAIFDEVCKSAFHQFVVEPMGSAKQISIFHIEYKGKPNAKLINPQDFNRTKINAFVLNETMKPTELLNFLTEFKSFCERIKK